MPNSVSQFGRVRSYESSWPVSSTFILLYVVMLGSMNIPILQNFCTGLKPTTKSGFGGGDPGGKYDASGVRVRVPGD